MSRRPKDSHLALATHEEILDADDDSLSRIMAAAPKIATYTDSEFEFLKLALEEVQHRRERAQKRHQHQPQIAWAEVADVR